MYEKILASKPVQYMVALGVGIGMSLGVSTNSMNSIDGLVQIGPQSAEAVEFKKEGWAVPDLTNAQKLGTRPADMIKKIDGSETKETGYKVNGKYVHIFQMNNQTYGIGLDTNGEYPLEWMLIDQNGDGKFTHRYGEKENWEAPKYLNADNLLSKK